MKQYEIWWASLDLPIGRRPVLLLSRPAAYEYLNRIIVAEITSTIRGIAVEVALGSQDGLPRRCVANLDNLHVVPKESLRTRIGALAAARVPEVKRALGSALDWPELK
ncbi:MAG: type II toxin-antitoxin system PemK/MazF family toxin [Myxococcales bacterium]|nr:type II toxin-antitoxin system PemK/MazF family toxin [Myxococcales bacterium]